MKNNLQDYVIDYSLLKLLSKEDKNKYKIIPINKHNIYILIACVDDNIDINKISKIFNYPIKIINISDIQFESFYENIDIKILMHSLSEQCLNQVSKFNTHESKITLFCNNLFELAIKMNSSDIHVETHKNNLIIRFRIHGVLENIFSYPILLHSILSSILKLFASLDVSMNNLPQNGRFSRYVNSKEYDFRISIMPSYNGESIVLRILDNEKVFIKLKEIGFENDLYDVIKRNINTTQGLILVTGPTGSGKTTTMYSMLNSIIKKDKKIITIEDPIEYKIDDITQININKDIGLDYNVVLKNILRQDPDILMIGEIRDKEALDIVIQAALTGHLVIATLHTNDAIKTLNRLFDMNVKPYLLASVLKLIISQRLYRVLCENCKKQIIKNQKVIYENSACNKCNFTGYSNRGVIAQYLQITKENEKYIHDVNNINKFKKYTNIKSLNESLYCKVLEGKTTLSEYYKNEI